MIGDLAFPARLIILCSIKILRHSPALYPSNNYYMKRTENGREEEGVKVINQFWITLGKELEFQLSRSHQ